MILITYKIEIAERKTQFKDTKSRKQISSDSVKKGGISTTQQKKMHIEHEQSIYREGKLKGQSESQP